MTDIIKTKPKQEGYDKGEYFVFKFRKSYGGDLRILHRKQQVYTMKDINEIIIDPTSLSELKKFLSISPKNDLHVGRYQKIYSIYKNRVTTIFILDTVNGIIKKKVVAE